MSGIKVALAGDWHGNTHWAVGRLMSLAAKHPGIDTILHAGDFGVWPGRSGQAYLDVLERRCAWAGIRILVTPGNHEDWGRLDDFWAEHDGPLALSEHISVLPRGHRFELGGRSFVSLGGGPSVDYDLPHRVPDESWWAGEAITPRDVRRVVAGGPADIMLTHDCPDQPWMTPAVEEIVSSEDSPWSAEALTYADEGRRLLTEAFLGVSPRLLVHGHYHVRDSADVMLPDGQACRIEALAHDGEPGNMAILDLSTLTVTDL